MKLTKEAIISIVLVILFVGSIFGIALGSKPPETNPIDPDVPIDVIDQNAPAEMYVSTMDVNVVDIYPQIILIANTTVFDEALIYNELIKIDGIKKPEINFTKGEDQNIMVIAKTIIDAEKKSEIVTNIQNLEFITNPEFYQSALLSIPQEKIILSGDNNKTKEYQFTTEKMEGIISINTQKKDMLSAQVQIVFKGEMPVEFLLIESQNLTTSPQMIYDAISLPIKNLLEEYRITTNTILANELDENQIKEILVDYNVFEINKQAKNNLKIDNLKVNVEDLNTYLINEKDLNESIIMNFTINENDTDVYFSDDLNYSKYIGFLEDINSMVIDQNYILEEPQVTYEIIFKETINLDEIVIILSNNNFNKIKKYQNAEFDISEIIINEKTYIYEDGLTTAWVNYPDSINKETINLQIQGFAQRDVLMFVSLTEK